MTKIRLILADKVEIFRKGLVKLIEGVPNIEVVAECPLGIEAIEELLHKHRPDIIMMDTGYPENTGIEIAKYIQKELPEINIIMLTHSEIENDLISATMAGVKGYLSKDISIVSLIKAITLVAEGGIVISSPMAKRLLEEFKSLEEGKDTSQLVIHLSNQEHKVLSLTERGLTNREIATTLFISENTVKVHLRNIMEKLHAHTRQQAVNLARGKYLPLEVMQTDKK